MHHEKLFVMNYLKLSRKFQKDFKFSEMLCHKQQDCYKFCILTKMQAKKILLKFLMKKKTGVPKYEANG